MKVFKLIEVDLAAVRKRIKTVNYTERQKEALLKLSDLFEAGEWQKCLDHVHDKKAFPYNRRGGYPETEHIDVQLSDVLRELGHSKFFTQGQLLAEVRGTRDSAKSVDKAIDAFNLLCAVTRCTCSPAPKAKPCARCQAAAALGALENRESGVQGTPDSQS